MKRVFRLGLAVVMCWMMLAVFAGPAFAQSPVEPPTAAGDLSAAVLALIALGISFVMGGGLAYFLEMLPQWKAWQSPVKGYLVIALSVLIGAALTSFKVLATPELFAQAPEWLRAALGFAVVSLTVLFGSQLTYQRGFAQWK